MEDLRGLHRFKQAYPKDSFPLPRIDQLVDATSGHALLSFMDAYSGYNQIQMHVPNQEHTSFITDHELYCYKVMPFGLKNTRATYQRLVNDVREANRQDYGGLRGPHARQVKDHCGSRRTSFRHFGCPTEILDEVKSVEVSVRSGLWEVPLLHGQP